MLKSKTEFHTTIVRSAEMDVRGYIIPEPHGHILQKPLIGHFPHGLFSRGFLEGKRPIKAYSEKRPIEVAELSIIGECQMAL